MEIYFLKCNCVLHVNYDRRVTICKVIRTKYFVQDELFKKYAVHKKVNSINRAMHRERKDVECF